MEHVRRCSGQLYSILEVPPNASEAEIRRAYHRKAMLYHPDKVGDSFRSQFQQIQEADEILRNPQRRRLYDLFGRAGMRAIEGGLGAEYADLLVSNLHRIRWLFLLLAYFFLLCFIEMLVLVRQVDGNAGYDWFLVFIPLWIIDLLIGGAGLYLFFVMLRHPTKILDHFATFGVCASLVCGSVFVALALNGSLAWDIAFTPLLSLAALYAYTDLRQAGLMTYREGLQQAGDPDAAEVTWTSDGYIAYVITIVWRVACITAFSVMMWLRSTGRFPISFYVVFTPLFLWMWLPLVWRLYVVCFTQRLVKHVSDKMIMAFMLLFSYTNSFLTLGLLAVKCHQAELGLPQISLVYILLSPMSLCVLLTLLMCAVALALPSDMMSLGAHDAFSKGYETATTAAASAEPLMQAARAAAQFRPDAPHDPVCRRAAPVYGATDAAPK